MLLCLILTVFPFFSNSINILKWKSNQNTQLFYIYSPQSVDSISFLQTWEEFTNKYKSNKNISLNTVNCTNDIKFCNKFHIHQFPSILKIHENFYQLHNISNKSIENLESILINSKETIPMFCKNHYFNEPSPTFEYPIFVLKSNSDDACLDVSKYNLLYPNVSFNYRHLNSTQDFGKIELYTSPDKLIVDPSIYNIDNFIIEYIHEQFGDWNFTDAKKLVRRLILIIYDENSTSSIPQKVDFEKYINRFNTKLLFNKMSYSDFIKIAGTSIKFPNFPFMVVTNTRKTRFMVLDYKKMESEYLENYFQGITLGFKELHINYYLDTIKNSIQRYKPKRMLAFFLTSLSVLAFTSLLLIIKAYRCIHTDHRKPAALRKRAMF